MPQPAGRPSCRHGTACYRGSQHRLEVAHPPDPDWEAPPPPAAARNPKRPAQSTDSVAPPAKAARAAAGTARPSVATQSGDGGRWEAVSVAPGQQASLFIRNFGSGGGGKVAGFDMDWTLIKTKSGNTSRRRDCHLMAPPLCIH